jgi:hypothetical protein
MDKLSFLLILNIFPCVSGAVMMRCFCVSSVLFIYPIMNQGPPCVSGGHASAVVKLAVAMKRLAVRFPRATSEKITFCLFSSRLLNGQPLNGCAKRTRNAREMGSLNGLLSCHEAKLTT